MTILVFDAAHQSISMRHNWIVSKRLIQNFINKAKL